jgi:hypothetical protein
MKKHLKTISALFALFTMLAAGVAMAAGPWSSAVLISGIELDPVGTTGTSTYLRFASTPSGMPACGTAGQVFLSGGSDHVKAMTTLSTAAFLAGRTVKMYWEGGCTAGVYANVLDLAIQ